MAPRKIIIAFSLILLVSCSSKKDVQYIDRVQYVEVPVYEEVTFEQPKKPIYYIKNLNNKSSPSEIVEAYVNTIKELNAYIEKLESLVNPFIKKGK